MEKFGVMLPHGGLNGDIATCISHLCNQTKLPTHIHVLVDTNNRSVVPAWVIALCRNVNVQLTVEYDATTTSIIDMRLKLLSSMHRLGIHTAVFVDDDMILQHGALETLYECYRYYLSDVPFVEGMRIEVGGRDTNGFNTTERKLQSASELVGAASGPQDYGDTALLLVDVEKFLQLPPETTEKLLAFYDKRGVGGSDFALTSLVVRQFGSGVGCPAAFGWHTAREQTGYWQNYAAADSIFDNVFAKGAK